MLRFVYLPVTESFCLDSDENFRADLRSVDHVGSVFGIQELWILPNISFVFFLLPLQTIQIIYDTLINLITHQR